MNLAFHWLPGHGPRRGAPVSCNQRSRVATKLCHLSAVPQERASSEWTGQPHKQLFCQYICNSVAQQRAWKGRVPWRCRSL